ncbi:hypothetical protein V1478_017600, partial [Vespula squamosa]
PSNSANLDSADLDLHREVSDLSQGNSSGQIYQTTAPNSRIRLLPLMVLSQPTATKHSSVSSVSSVQTPMTEVAAKNL